MRRTSRCVASILAIALASALTPGCGIIISETRRALSGSGGGTLAGAHVSGATSGGMARRPISCGGAASSPQNVYTFVAPQTGTYTFESRTSDYDGVLAVYAASGSELACNDDYQDTRSSQVMVALSEGQAVEVIQGGYAGGSGHYELWGVGAASDQSSIALGDGQGVVAAPLPPAPVQPLAPGTMVTGQTTGFGSVEGYVDCPPAGPMQEWSFNPTESGSYLFQVDSQYDAYLGVLSAIDGTTLGCNDDWGDTSHARVATQLVAGESYRVIVGGLAQQSGAYSLTAVALQPSGALTIHQPVLIEPGDTDTAPDVCGAPAGSVDRTFTFTPRQEGFYSVYADVTGWLVVGDGREIVACLPLSPAVRSGLLLKARHRYSLVFELGYPDEMVHTVVVDRVAPDAPDWQVPPSVPPIAAMLPPSLPSLP